MSTPTVSDDLRLLTRCEAAELLRVSIRGLERLTRRGEIPAARVGRRVLYRESDLIAYVDRVAAPVSAR